MKEIELERDLIIRSLQALGCPASPGESSAEPDFGVKQPSPGKVYVMHPRGQEEIVVPVTVTNLSYAPLTICGFQCRMPQGTVHAQWLHPATPESDNFRLPSGRQFPRCALLNCAEHHHTLDCNESVTGILLGLADCDFPDDYLHGEEFSAELVIIDQHGRRHASEIFVVVERTTQMAAIDFTRKPGPGLFASVAKQGSVSEQRNRETEFIDDRSAVRVHRPSPAAGDRAI